ncbi:MAG: hypothetical protein N2558_00880 [Patescibacteria group bacterium]|nr:hypothetical protein [Patescibacteria group bacterium]
MLFEDFYKHMLTNVSFSGNFGFDWVFNTFPFNFFGFEIEPTYWQAAVIIILLFLLIFTLARVRYLYVHWSLGSSAWAMLLWGFLLAIILEGLILFSGKTILIHILGWENIPQPVGLFLDSGKEKFLQVLGVTDNSYERKVLNLNYQEVVQSFRNLSDFEKKKARIFICEP